MTPTEVGLLLTQISAFDNRKLSIATADEWAQALDANIVLADAQQIVREHFANTTDWLMPAHINAASRKLRATRIDRAGTNTDLPPGLDGQTYRAWLTSWRTAIGDGQTRDEATRTADAANGIIRDPNLLIGPPDTSLAELVARASMTTTGRN